jgi:hypothetical protein
MDGAWRATTASIRDVLANAFFGAFSDGRLFSPSMGCIGNLAARGVYDVSGLTALSLVGEKGRFRWAEPRAPAEAVIVAGEERPGEESGAPLNDVKVDKLIVKWLIAGPFAAGAAPPDKLADLRARPGVKISAGGRQSDFQPLPAQWIKDTPGCGPKLQAIHLPNAGPESTHYLYCELQADGQQAGTLDWRHLLADGASRLWLNGREMNNGVNVVLEPGRHRMLVEMSGSLVSPCLLAGNAWRAVAMQKRYAWEHAVWHDARQRHADTGLMTDTEYSLQMCRHVYRDHLRRVAEEIRASGRYVRGSLLFGAAVRVACGEQLFIDTPSAITAAPRASLPYLSAEELCLSMGMAPANLQPALAREFQRRFLPDKLGQLDCILLAAALVNYPLDMPHRGLSGPDDPMIASREESNITMFAGGERDIQCQVALRDEKPRLISPEVFVPRAGALLLRGLGSDWITNGPSPKGRHEAVVEIEGATSTGFCRVVDFQSSKAGTALLDIDMSPVYQRPDGQAIEARRQVAVDYTGRSGADVLLVVLDRIRGKGKKTWTLPTGARYVDYGQQTYYTGRVPGTGKSLAVIQSVAISPSDSAAMQSNEFRLRTETESSRGSRPTGRGMILRPAKCEVTFVATIAKRSEVPVLQATADSENVEFLVVLTLQHGAPPPVSFQGEGPNGVLAVGKQTLRLADGRISWGQ